MTASFPLAIIGCDFRVAPASARSLLVLNTEEEQALAKSLIGGSWAEGIAFLNTCNRNEWLVSADDPMWAADLLKSRMQQQLPSALRAQLTPYTYVGEEAARHIFRVALGQESLVVGERQIAGQVFKSLAAARQSGHSARHLNALESTIGKLVRVAKHRGCLQSTSIGAHSLAISWLRQQLPIGSRRVAVVGMGAIGRLVLTSLNHDPTFSAVALNRTIHPRSSARPLTELPDVLKNVDAAIFCTASRVPIYNPALSCPGSPLTVVDLGIPEQVVSDCTGTQVQRVGFDELVLWYQRKGTQNPDADSAVIEELLSRALIEYKRTSTPPAFAPVINDVRSRSRTLLRTEMRALLDDKLSSISPNERAVIEDDLSTLLGEYTDDILQTISGGALDSSREPQ